MAGTGSGDFAKIEYTYNHDNFLIGYQNSTDQGDLGPTFKFGRMDQSTFYLDAKVDGLGRLADDAYEELAKPGSRTVSHTLKYTYDRMSQLTYAGISEIDSQTWTGDYDYHKDGNLDDRTIEHILITLAR